MNPTTTLLCVFAVAFLLTMAAAQAAPRSEMVTPGFKACAQQMPDHKASATTADVLAAAPRPAAAGQAVQVASAPAPRCAVKGKS